MNKRFRLAIPCLVISIALFGIIVDAYFQGPVTEAGNQTGSQIKLTTNLLKDECNFIEGCWENERCYPVGYRKDGEFCAQYDDEFRDKLPEFINQTPAGNSCSQNYECETNICSDNLCLNLTEEIIRLDKLKREVSLLLENSIKLDIRNESTIENNNSNIQNKQQENTFVKLIYFLKNILN